MTWTRRRRPPRRGHPCPRSFRIGPPGSRSGPTGPPRLRAPLRPRGLVPVRMRCPVLRPSRCSPAPSEPPSMSSPPHTDLNMNECDEVKPHE
ncbi:unnamed protein product [Euphydryas editha]|uniref:Uncharacterized protein n=1 Tax=Euphydryas editha TaxID=104508 RepID=A0AAU9UBI3_EUPED|nr:unnamed protein product [Euphydryas editha]